MYPFKAIAAMAENRVIGRENRIPWHLPEDFRWFKQTTTGHVLVMGRKTFESIGRPLPHRTTLVLTRSGFTHPGVGIVTDLSQIRPAGDPRDYFICGGAEIYRQALPLCSDLYLTLVKGVIDGDTFFPPFEHLFQPVGELLVRPDFRVIHYRRRASADHFPGPPPAVL